MENLHHLTEQYRREDLNETENIVFPMGEAEISFVSLLPLLILFGVW